MGSIVSSITGIGGGGSAGLGYKAQGANLIQPATQDQANQNYGQVQQGLTQQQAFLQALQAQNGLQNQSNVYNQLQGVANGTGPNPAQAQLNQATGANVANQAALMAGQRGASQNTGLIARQAAQQGANTQQQAAGQAASLQAQQSLNALGQMGNLATNQANQQANATNAYTQNALTGQQNTLGAIGAYNNANVGMQSNINNNNAAIAGNAAGQQGNFFGNLMGGAGSALNLFGSGSSAAGGASDGLSGMSSLGDAGQYAGGLEDAGDVASLAAKGGKVQTQGVKAPMFADGGDIGYTTPMAMPTEAPTGPQSNAGKSFMKQEDALGASNLSGTAMPMSAAKKPAGGGSPLGGLPGVGGGTGGMGGGLNMNSLGQGQDFLHNAITGEHAAPREGGGAGIQWDWGDAGKGAAKGASYGSWIGPWGTAIGGAAGFLAGGASYQAEGGKIPGMVSPGEKILTPKDVKKAEKGTNPMRLGKEVKGKAAVGGAINDYRNDTVPTDLPVGGIVLPRSVTQAADAPTRAAHFVAAIQAKEKHGKKRK